MKQPIHITPAPGRRLESRILPILTWFAVGWTSGIALCAIPSCGHLKNAANSPMIAPVIGAGGAVLVSQAVMQRPEIRPTLLALADYKEGLSVDLSTLNQPLLAAAVQVVDEITTHYGDVATDDLIVRSIRDGIEIAGGGAK